MRIFALLSIALCLLFGAWLADETMVSYESEDMLRRVSPYIKECHVGSPNDCYFAAHEYMIGENGVKWYNKAANYYKLACDGGVYKACSNLGILYQNGLGVKQNYDVSVQLYKLACSRFEPDACNNLGVLSEEGIFVNKNYSDALALYGRACQGGSVAGCVNLGDMYAKGKGVSKSRKAALEFYGQACALGYQEGCDLYRENH